jgi:hypothetical protein
LIAFIIFIIALIFIVKILLEFNYSMEGVILSFATAVIATIVILLVFASSLIPAGDLVYEKIDVNRSIFIDSGQILYYKENNMRQQSVNIRYLTFNTKGENLVVFYSKEETIPFWFPNIKSYDAKILKEIRLGTSVKLESINKEE